MGADVITRMFVADSGGDHTSYAHRGCAEAAGTAVVLEGQTWEPGQLAPAGPATGGCCVGLYACISDSRDPDTMLDALRTYASAQGWIVTAALYDVGPLDRPKDKRPGLTRALRLLEDGRIQGLVTLTAAHLAVAAPFRELAAGSFISYVQPNEVSAP
ncbi:MULTISPECIES: hypothetical protein [unclassified Streptomyces]|uniref:Resolvase/invertase-type recombinase catalytic domain-containing protein n=1 Tax=Streptomyces sp. NBC_00060 TaxID=2975636 RepID=A0AAU2H5R6_9ACTN